MPSVRQIKRRIRSVQNTSKITKAMSMIAASKMRRTQEAALEGRPYSESMVALMADIISQMGDDDYSHPLLEIREERVSSLIILSPDRGLTGGLNSNINRAVAEFISNKKNNSVDVDTITIGKKGRDFVNSLNIDVKAEIIGISDKPSLLDITPAVSIAIDNFQNKKIDAIYIAYAKFINTTNQQPVVEPILPIDSSMIENHKSLGYIFEPSPAEIFSKLLPRFVEMQVFHALLEGIASEQSARMVAMRNATDNANEMVEDLTLVMNKVRQESITAELLDIVGGVAAVE